MSKHKTAQLRASVKPYSFANNRKSIWQLINTIPPLLLIWFFAYKSMSITPWLSLGLSILAAGFVVRTFIIFHDCTHGSFFHNKRLNDLIGTITGVMTLFPYEKWKREHSIHHATSSNLDKRGIGDIWVMTIEEYTAASKWQRLGYRLYRNPLIMFGLGPLYLMLIVNRKNRSDARKKERMNTYLTNVLVVIMFVALVFIAGWKAVLLVHGVTLYVATLLGIWLFFIQHTFEDSYFEEEAEWDYVKAAVEGSSYYRLPRVLEWITGNIGYHHVHHLAPRIPNYHLEEAHVATPPLQHATTITIRTSLASLQYHVYDPEQKQFMTFKEAKRLLASEKPISTERKNLTPRMDAK